MLFILILQPQFSINLQLIGGVIILQTLPSVFVGLYTRWPHRGALIGGWVAGMACGVWMLYVTGNAATKQAHWGGSAFALSHLGIDSKVQIYTGFVAVLINLIVAGVLTVVFKAVKAADGPDDTAPSDYFTDAEDLEHVPAEIAVA